ncbi:MAG: glycosyltransferase family 2 protein [Acidobacteriota bacterium]|nr:glycosyltransferase family 2 protein [Acidobacteriota bacterium]
MSTSSASEIRGSTPALSVVIPAFNEQGRLGSTLGSIVSFLDRRGEDYEIIVVDDASTDATQELLEDLAMAPVRVLRQPQNLGKGAAVRRGVLASRGVRVLLTDADLSTPIEDLEILERLIGEADFALGSRATRESRITKRQPLFREIMGRIFNRIIRSLGLAHIHDTQCGFKLIDGRAARKVFSFAKVDRFAFDVEMVWLARHLGYKVVETGVHWHNSPRSTVNPVLDSASMLWDVVKLRCRRPPGR